MGGVRLTLAASCAVAFCGHFGVPREVTSKSEPFVTVLFQAHLQLALKECRGVQKQTRSRILDDVVDASRRRRRRRLDDASTTPSRLDAAETPPRRRRAVVLGVVELPVDDAEIRLDDAETRLDDAETRLDDAETRLDDAEPPPSSLACPWPIFTLSLCSPSKPIESTSTLLLSPRTLRVLAACQRPTGQLGRARAPGAAPEAPTAHLSSDDSMPPQTCARTRASRPRIEAASRRSQSAR